MFSWQLSTRVTTQAVIITDTETPNELCITLPNGESTYVNAADLYDMLLQYEKQRDTRQRLLDRISTYSTETLKFILNSRYGKDDMQPISEPPC